MVFGELLGCGWVDCGLLGLLFAASMPIRQAYLNGLIPSQQRASILSFDSMLGSTEVVPGPAPPSK